MMISVQINVGTTKFQERTTTANSEACDIKLCSVTIGPNFKGILVEVKDLKKSTESSDSFKFTISKEII